MENLVDLKPLSEVAQTLIEKFSSGISWICNRQTPARIAVDTLIADIQKSEMDPVNKAVLISQAKKIIREQANQKAILDNAIQSLTQTAKPEMVNPDWLAQFEDKTRLVSDELFQFIWGKILAQECNEPNSIPKSLLNILEQMDKEDAECFTRICEYTVEALDGEGNIIGHFPLIIPEEGDAGFKHDFEYERLADLNGLGLINLTELGLLVYTNAVKVFRYGDEEFVLPEDVETISIGKISFTKAGEALCKAIDAELHENFLRDDCIPFWNETTIQKKEAGNLIERIRKRKEIEI